MLTGWSVPEQKGTWSSAQLAYLGLIIDGTTTPKQVIVHGSVFFVPGKLEEQRIQVWSSNNKLADFDLKVQDLKSQTANLGIPLQQKFHQATVHL